MATKKAEKKTSKKRKKRGMSCSYVDEFLAASNRAKKLYERIVENGYALKKAGANPRPLSNPDRWDVAEYLFFEVAAKFEQFAKRTLVLEVQKSLSVNRTRAEHMVGSSESGILAGMGGWAHVSKMKKRATGLLGRNSVYAKIENHLGNPKLKYLQMAVTIRNRIAHAKGNKGFTEMLRKVPVRLARISQRLAAAGAAKGTLAALRLLGLLDVLSNTPAEPSRRAPCARTLSHALATQPVEKCGLNANQRRGVSPGKFLAEYPKAAQDADKWFFRILDAYETWVKIVRRKI